MKASWLCCRRGVAGARLAIARLGHVVEVVELRLHPKELRRGEEHHEQTRCELPEEGVEASAISSHCPERKMSKCSLSSSKFNVNGARRHASATDITVWPGLHDGRLRACVRACVQLFHFATSDINVRAGMHIGPLGASG